MHSGAAYELVEIMRRLRAPDGCPWDREQTLATLKKYLVEECYETIDAIDHGTPDEHLDELGDLLLQIAFQSQLRAEEGAFTFEDVAAGICRKMIRRHPHVFGEVDADTADDVVRNWEQIKREERGEDAEANASVLGSVPRSLPALRRAQKLQSRAARVGFDWPSHEGAVEKVAEELDELRAAAADGDQDAIADEAGDLLFAAVNAARLLGLDAEDTLDAALVKFRSRFEGVEARVAGEGRSMSDCTLDELEAHWQSVKRAAAGPDHA